MRGHRIPGDEKPQGRRVCGASGDLMATLHGRTTEFSLYQTGSGTFRVKEPQALQLQHDKGAD